MAIITRLDKRSEENNRFAIIHDDTGEIIAVISTLSNKTELQIETAEGTHITKPNGYSSKK